MSWDWTYSLAGVVVGFLVGLTGMGGGSLMTPLLILMFNVSPSLAIGTDLLFASLTKLGGVFVHGRRGNIDWKVVRLLSMGSLPAAGITLLALKLYAGHEAEMRQVLTLALGAALLLTAPVVIFKDKLLSLAQSRLPLEHLTPWRPQVTVAVGVMLGVLVTLSSVGAGVLGTMALFFLYPYMPSVRIVGTDIAHAVPLTAIAGLGHWQMGNVDLALLGSLLIGSLPGIWLGSHVSHRVPERFLRPALGGMLLLFGVKFVTA